jgi:hypothetical protein
VAEVSGLPIARTALQYTNLYVRFGLGRDFAPDHPGWQRYVAGLRGGRDVRAWTYEFYRHESRGDGDPPVTARFGCFAYARSGEDRIRLQFRNAERDGASPLSHARKAERIAELSALFAHVRRTEPGPLRVAGASWLYNIEAYRRLFPPPYLATARVVGDRFQRMPLWGQFLDHRGDVKPSLVREFRERLARLQTIDGLGRCFPLQVRALEAPVRAFYDFHGV